MLLVLPTLAAKCGPRERHGMSWLLGAGAMIGIVIMVGTWFMPPRVRMQVSDRWLQEHVRD